MAIPLALGSVVKQGLAKLLKIKFLLLTIKEKISLGSHISTQRGEEIR